MIWSTNSRSVNEFVKTVRERVARRQLNSDESYNRLNDPIISKAYSTMGNMPDQLESTKSTKSTRPTTTTTSDSPAKKRLPQLNRNHKVFTSNSCFSFDLFNF